MTDTTNQTSETFEDFKKSFSYGTRSDLNFKFLADLPDEDAANFFQTLLWELGEVMDGGDFSRIIDHMVRWQVEAYKGAGKWTYDQAPFTPLGKPLSESRLALITSTGHFVEGDDPQPFGVEDMTQEEAVRRIGEFIKAEPVLSSIPMDTPPGRLRVRHGGYDIRGVQSDRNVAFPIDRLREFDEEGTISELLPDAYSFVGATAQLKLLNRTGPRWVRMLKEQVIDTVLLVPV